ncbi:hypothetical protein CPB83DRAFT_850871 [Crepidotus variabilis]|uniref:Uncharacterized protein n=1 Tax=Crepidotus variabilis TaxID=179855 RepID=A0A9P6EJW6_9AGAR|nr:hypothetical protein CPB83DRAFT_850871 [Crepidotus variabilis]
MGGPLASRIPSTEKTIDREQQWLNKTSQDDARTFRRARKNVSLTTLCEGAVDFVIAISSLYFIVFAGLVYTHKGQPADLPFNNSLLQAAKYGPTVFPIVFAAIVAKFLRNVATFKLEKGVKVLTLEHLLTSRTVFGAFTAMFTLQSIHLLTPLLIILWALSPLGGQASLRIIGTEPDFTSSPNNFSYLAFASSFSNEGQTSASAELLIPIDAAFTGALISSASSKKSHQDPYGNIRIPIYDKLPSARPTSGKDWRNVPSDGAVWSALAGIPVHGLPSSGVSRFTLNTGYMTTDCQVTGEDTKMLFTSLNNATYIGSSGGWSGANFVIASYIMTYPSAPAANFTFRALASQLAVTGTNKTLTVASCTINMEYVEVQVECDGSICHNVAARPAPNPASHIFPPLLNGKKNEAANLTQNSPLNGLAQTDAMVLAFWRNFVNATNPYIGCDTSFCPTSGVEGYLLDPNSPFSVSTTPLIWQQGNELVSQRFTQLINTYWLDSIAPDTIAGNFSVDAANRFNIDSTIGSIQTQQEVIKCDYLWLTILLISSLVMLLCGIAAVVFGMLRRGPDILDHFTGLLRDNPYVSDQQYSSMDNVVAQAKRLRNVTVRLGDVSPEDDVGYVAIAAVGGEVAVEKLSPRRLYR